MAAPTLNNKKRSDVVSAIDTLKKTITEFEATKEGGSSGFLIMQIKLLISQIEAKMNFIKG